MKKKLLFLTHPIPALSYGYRIQQYFPYFEEKGYEVSHLTSRASISVLIRALRGADLVYVQRLLPSLLKQQLLKMAAGRMVFDFDDAIMYGSRKESATRRRRFARMVRLARAVFCGNQFLLDEARKYKAEQVFYVPTVVETRDYPVKEHVGAVPFVVGWLGSAATLRYLADIEGVLASRPPDTVYRVVADRVPETLRRRVEFERWSREREKDLLLGFDVGIMPVRDDIWSRGKCGLKLIQYAASGLPAISHPLGVAGEIIEEGESGFLREDTEGWREAVRRLRDDVQLRKAMGRRARAIAEERYALQVWGPRVAAMVDAL
jgi:glycosyltransferase involved in cell wall biosynthesis